MSIVGDNGPSPTTLDVKIRDHLVFTLRAQGSLFLRPQWYVGVRFSVVPISVLGGSARSTLDGIKSQKSSCAGEEGAGRNLSRKLFQVEADSCLRGSARSTLYGV